MVRNGSAKRAVNVDDLLIFWRTETFMIDLPANSPRSIFIGAI
jgi:hypothetical protein